MTPDARLQRTVTSRRWVQFIESTAIGLHLNITLTSPSTVLFSVPRICPVCGRVFDWQPENTQELFGECRRIAKEPEEIILKMPLSDNYLIVFQDCPCNRERDVPPLDRRAAIAHNLIYSFYTALSEGISNGHSALELTALRQMNRIILSKFCGEPDSLAKACDLILSTLIIILEAKTSWLEYFDGRETRLLVKGDQATFKALTKSGNRATDHVLVEPINGITQGALGVGEPQDSERARTLLPLMAQECGIIFQIENLFQLLQAQLTKVLGSLDSAVILVDPQKYIIFTNTVADELLGINYLNMVGKNAGTDLFPWGTYFNGKADEPASGAKSSFPRGTEQRWIDWSVTPIKDAEQTAGWLVNANDRTEFYRWQEVGRQAESFAMAASMIGPLAHELRNPLASIKGLLQLAKIKKEPEKMQSYVEIVLKEIDRMALLVNDFLQIGRTTDFNLEPTDLTALIEDLIPLITKEAQNLKVQIHLNLEQVPPFPANARQLTQVLLNLIRNSYEAIEAQGRGGDLWLKLSQTNDLVYLEIRDNGTGFRPEILKNVFNPFFTTKETGTGLGLAITKAIINNHGGQISAANAPEGGALFLIKLPLLKDPVKFQTLDVLITLCDETDVYPIEQVLKSAGFLVRITSHLEQAASLATLYQPKVILIDVGLDKALFEQLSSVWPNSNFIAIGENITVALKDAIFLPKPLDFAKLVVEVRPMLVGKREVTGDGQNFAR